LRKSSQGQDLNDLDFKLANVLALLKFFLNFFKDVTNLCNFIKFFVFAAFFGFLIWQTMNRLIIKTLPSLSMKESKS